MVATLTDRMAQKIVDSVKEVCGFDINFINTKGVIFASTDSSRIGEYHEIGKTVAETREAIEVCSNESYLGTKMGVNLPFVYDRKLIAVIGISGEPQEVKRYAILAQRIATMMLKEHEMEHQNFGRKSQISFVLHALLENQDIHFDYLRDFMEQHQLSVQDKYYVILTRLNSRYNPANLSMIENLILQEFEQIPHALYTYHYPNEYWLLLNEEAFMRWRFVLESLSRKYQELLRIGVGSCETLSKISLSYISASIAVQTELVHESFVCYDDLTLAIILGSLPKDLQKRYCDRTIGSLSEKDIQLLKTYFFHDQSLQETSEQLFLHKNTLQNRLKVIHKTTGLDPRKFQDAVVLYLGILLR